MFYYFFIFLWDELSLQDSLSIFNQLNMKYLDQLKPVDRIYLNNNFVQVFELGDLNENEIKEWADHFRQIYCLDSVIDEARDGTGLSRKDYLLNLVFPSQSEGFGPATRLGDFAELLIADFLTYKHNFFVPKDRYVAKFNRNTSSQGTDVIGFKTDPNNPNKDELIVIEVKAKAKNGRPISRLQEAVIDVQKKTDEKLGVTLNAIKHRALFRKDNQIVQLIKRFQNKVDKPFIIKYGAAAVQDISLYKKELVGATIIPASVDSVLFINRQNLMLLVNELYKMAADIND